MLTQKFYNQFYVGKNEICIGNFQKNALSKYSIKSCCKQITSIQKFVCPYK